MNKLPFKAYLRLTRLPNALTAMADAAMGFLIVQPGGGRTGQMPPREFWTLAALMSASAILYMAGVVLNDWYDLETDRVERPRRPLPSGEISPTAAARLGWSLLWLGILAAGGAAVMAGQPRPAVVAVLLAAAIVGYDARLKRTPLAPAAMGLCRGLNVLLGVSAFSLPLGAAQLLAAGGIGVYVAGITWFARRENTRGNRPHLAAATAVMALGIALVGCYPHWADNMLPPLRAEPKKWHLLIGALGAVILWRAARAVVDPAPRRVRRAVAQCVLSIVMLDAAACYAVRDLYWAGTLLVLLFIPATLLARQIEVT
jgi:4-hydroxybenzoate polyprenyltransferase